MIFFLKTCRRGSVSPDPHDELIGTTLAQDFKVLRQLGFGGYARVYLAEQLSVARRQVAIKVLHQTYLGDRGETALLAFRREASFLAMLRSPCFPRILRAGVTPDGRPFYAMEFVHGKSLDVVIKEQGALDMPVAIPIVDTVCDGIAEMHEKDLLHRDIKPSNILLEQSSPNVFRVKIADLGTAKAVCTPSVTDPSVAVHTIGSPPYLPPETVQSGVYTEASDQYAIACVAYELLCGIKAVYVANPTPEDYIAYIGSQAQIPTYPIRTIEPSVPEEIEMVIERALSRDPKKRFASVHDFRIALRHAAGAQAVYGVAILVDQHEKGAKRKVRSSVAKRLLDIVHRPRRK
jgi:serine/threonine-protein kinase